MPKYRLIFSLIVLSFAFINTKAQQDKTKTNPPIYIAFHWHMHQPIYMPYENINTTANSGAYSYNIYDIFNQRVGPYTSWPKDAVQKGITANLPHLGAQVSLSGSLVENLNNLAAVGACNGSFNTWKNSWTYITGQKTSLNNPRLDLVSFGYHHPLMGLIENSDIRKQIQEHKQLFATNFPAYTYSKGIFPPENAFSERMIPALKDEGLQWVMVDNFNFDRAADGCPTGDASGVLRPNKADIINPNPNDWKSLNGLWMPMATSMQWGHQPHYVQYVNPATGEIKKMIAVPTSRYLGNEDGRGGFGALNYETVMSQMESYNTDTDHPMLIILHHDGDNYGGGSEGYYGGNFQGFVDWLQANPSRFVCTTVQDYVDMFPPATDDVIHVQDGSWVGADSGDPEFKKWNGDPGTYMGTTPNYSPDRNSWGIVTAAKNIVQTAEQINPASAYTTQAWHYYLNSQTSCYWYWDGTEMWDSHPARACNLAVAQALNVVNSGADLTPPTIYIPQREPYNPGAIEWGTTVMPKDFTVWTYVFDYHNLTSVKLKYRIDTDGVNDLATTVNETYAGGTGVETWQELPMNATVQASITNPVPTYKADQYSAVIAGQESVLIDYYVEAVDGQGNTAKSDIQHVWVGDGSGGGPNPGSVSWTPEEPNWLEYITISCSYATAATKLHWGVNYSGSTWITPIASYRPLNTVVVGTAVETPFTDPDSDGNFTVVLGPFTDAGQVVNSVAFVIHDGDFWDSNNGADYHIIVNNDPGDEPVGANKTVSMLVNQNYTFSQADFYFNSGIGATFAGIQIITQETSGDLEYSNIDVTDGSECSDVSYLIFKPVIGETGNPYSTFTFRVKDSNGVLSLATYTMTVVVTSPNPTSGNASVNINKNETFTFGNSNFSFSSPNSASFAGISLSSLPEKGTLNYNGAAAEINTDYLDPALLTYTPISDETGIPYTSFDFKVKDSNGLYSLNAKHLTINVLGTFPNGVSWYPQYPTTNDVITIVVNNDEDMTAASRLHWGVGSSSNWVLPNAVYYPEGTTIWSDNKAVESPFTQSGSAWLINLGPFNNPAQNVNTINFVLHYGSTWSNQGDWHIPVTQYVNVETPSETSLKFYPNPMNDYAVIEINDSENARFIVSLKDISGRSVKTDIFESNSKYILNRNNLKSGIYLLELTNEISKKTIIQKIVIQ